MGVESAWGWKAPNRAKRRDVISKGETPVAPPIGTIGHGRGPAGSRQRS